MDQIDITTSDSSFQFSVIDSEHGIDPNIREKIFHPFLQLKELIKGWD